jgi:hypothetical protein
MCIRGTVTRSDVRPSPAAFLVGGDGPMTAELAQLKGQMVAIEQASIQKKCGIQFQQAQPTG